METVAAIFFAFALLVCIIYAFTFLLFTMGWLGTKEHVAAASTTRTRASILIAARNESVNIESCLESILKQEFDRSFYEVIVVDDHSEDDTFSKIERFRERNPSLNLEAVRVKNGSGKKQALMQAAALASG